MPDALQIAMLGAPRVHLDAEPASGFVSAKAEALVYYLAAAGREERRDRLAGLLWSDVDEARARKNLRDVLSNLRRVLGGSVEITRETVALPVQAGVDVDTRTFVTAVQAGTTASLAQAVALYHGEFLEGFYVAEAPLFEEWVLGEREYYRQLAQQALTSLADQFLRQGNRLRAMQAINRLLALDPWREEAHRQLMVLLAISGQPSAALAQYRKARAVLRDELGVEPAIETRMLYEQIRAGKLAVPDDATLPALVAVASTPAPAPVAPIPNNLPAQLETFIGRAGEVAQVQAKLLDPACRLLTVVGPGGMGKTSLALEAARGLVGGMAAGALRDGIYLATLSEIQPSSQAVAEALAGCVADSLSLPLAGAVPAHSQLVDYLRQKQMLIVLDDFDQLLDAAPLLVELLEHAAGLKLLVTSRRRLNVRGEHLLSLAGLPYPDALPAAQATRWESYTAIQLFLQRARSVEPGFEADEATLAAIGRLCQMLAGLPLAIELAASRVRSLSVHELLAEIERGIHELGGGPAGRHQSLEVVFDQSWRLLAPAEQRALQSLAIFRAGFGRAAAAAVGASHDQLAALVDHSLVQRATTHGPAGARYELLDALRFYVLERLDPGEAVTLGERHSAYFLAWLQPLQDDLLGRRQQDALNAIRLELDNVRAAWEWAVAQRNVAALEQVQQSLFHFYDMRSYFREGEERFGRAVQMAATLPEGSQRDRAWGVLLARWAWFTFHLGGQRAAQRQLERSLDLLRPLGDASLLAFPLNYLGAVELYLGDYPTAQAHCREALAASRAGGQWHGVVVAKSVLSQIAYAQGDYDEARRQGQESLAIDRERGNRWGMAYSLVTLGKVAYAIHDYAAAESRYQEALAVRRAMDDRRGQALCLTLLGDAATAQAELERAVGYFEQALAVFEDIGNRWGASDALARLGRTASEQGRYADAEAYLARALDQAVASDAVPVQLAVLAEFAVLRWRTAPEQAAELAALVQSHPSATEDSRARVATLPTSRVRAISDDPNVWLADLLAQTGKWYNAAAPGEVA